MLTRNEFAERIMCASIKYAEDGTALKQKDGKGMCVEKVNGTDDHLFNFNQRKQS